MTWVDERCVAWAHANSHQGAANLAGHLDALAPPFMELPLFRDGETPQPAWPRAAAVLTESIHDALDVVLLGMGEDGPVASLFPGHRALTAPGVVLVVEDSPKPPPVRVTLTLSMVTTASTVVLLARGAAKRPALARLLAGDAMLPASHLPNLVIITDQEIAGAHQ